MDMHAVILGAALVAGVVALETRRTTVSVAAIAAAIGLFAIAMGVAGALEVAIGGAVAAFAVAMLFRWAFNRTGGDDTVARMTRGAPAALGALTLVVFVVVAFVALGQYAAVEVAAESGVDGAGAMGLVREALVVVAAVAGIWAMMRGTGRRDE